MDTLDTNSKDFINGSFWANVKLTLSNSNGETASFELNSYENDKQKNNKGGMYLKDLTYTRIGDGASNNLEINIFDNASCIIEEKLSKYFRNLTFSYSSIDVVGTKAQEKEHGPYTMLITDWNTTLTAYGAQIRITAVSTGYARLQKSFEPGTCFEGPPHNAIKKIFDECGIGYKYKLLNDLEGKEYNISSIEETESVFVYNKEGDEQDKKIEKKYFYTGGSVQDFIEVIRQDARAKDKNHKGNYVFRYMDKITANGEPLGIFMSEDGFHSVFFENREHTFSFDYNTKNSNILNWSPVYSGKTLLGICGVEYYFNDGSGHTGKVVADGSVKPSKDKKKGESWYRDIFLGTEEEAKKAATEFLRRREFSAQEAKMTIVDYGSIEVLDTITVNVIGKDGAYHHTSGKWIVLDVTDHISGGLITTDVHLRLFKPIKEEQEIKDRYLPTYYES